MKARVLLITCLVLFASVFARSAAAQMSIDAPSQSSIVAQPFLVGGWAIDVNAPSGTGVSAVHIWAYPNPGSGASPIFLGAATYGGARPDVGAVYGSQFTNSSYGLFVRGQAPGLYQIVVFALSTVTGTFNQSMSVTVTMTTQPAMAIDAPNEGSTLFQPLTISGWALDLAAATGTGVDAVHIWAYPNPGSGADPIFWGGATYGTSRPDVGAYFGSSQFNNSGYSLTVSGQTLGTYLVVVYARSVITGTFNQWQTRNITIESPAIVRIDTPQSGNVLQPFTIEGWAIDRASSTGTGVDTVHVWAYPTSGSPIFIGGATYGIAKPAVGSLYGTRFTNSGYSLSSSILPSGSYQLVVFARRTLSGLFDVSATINVGVDLTASTPAFSPPPGTYSQVTDVVISAATSGATIRYTLDGSEPTQYSPVAGSSVAIQQSATLKAKAFAIGMLSSSTASGTYELVVSSPVASPAGGSYNEPQSVTLTTSTSGATIRYTTDGSDPTESSSFYTGPIAVEQTTTLKASGFRSGWTNSGILSGTYTINYPTEYQMSVEAFQGSIGCRMELRGIGLAEMLSYDAWLTDPDGTTIASDSKWTYSGIVRGEFSVEPATSGTYSCFVRFYADSVGYFPQRSAQQFINQCGDERGVMIGEYHQFGVSLTPTCTDFANGGGTPHFSWPQLNGGFSLGNPHNPWGMVKASLTNGLEMTLTNYNRGGITLNSGYRCPHGNANPEVGGAPQSRHMWGDAADVKSADHPWNQAEWELMRVAAVAAGATFIEPYAQDPSHVHADWR